jgi:flagellar basal body P-ring formation protein FlgA
MPTETPTKDRVFVRKLTATPVRRRKYVARRPLTAISAILFTSLLPHSANSQVETPQWQPVEQILATAEAFLRTRTGVFAGNTTVQAGNLDSRHRLPKCNEPLQAFMRTGADIQPRTIVGVRCKGARPWKIYVPVDIVVTASVLVARQTLAKGHVMTAADLALERRDVSRLRNGYLSDPLQVVGQRLKTQLIAGKTLKPSMVAADIAIRRGQSVTLTVGAGDFSISMTGTALMDGALNQRIRVQNNNSGRIVEGFVRSREHVEVLHLSNNHFFNAEPKVSPQVADMRLSNNDR